MTNNTGEKVVIFSAKYRRSSVVFNVKDRRYFVDFWAIIDDFDYLTKNGQKSVFSQKISFIT